MLYNKQYILEQFTIIIIEIQIQITIMIDIFFCVLSRKNLIRCNWAQTTVDAIFQRKEKSAVILIFPQMRLLFVDTVWSNIF